MRKPKVVKLRNKQPEPAIPIWTHKNPVMAAASHLTSCATDLSATGAITIVTHKNGAVSIHLFGRIKSNQCSMASVLLADAAVNAGMP